MKANDKNEKKRNNILYWVLIFVLVLVVGGLFLTSPAMTETKAEVAPVENGVTADSVSVDTSAGGKVPGAGEPEYSNVVELIAPISPLTNTAVSAEKAAVNAEEAAVSAEEAAEYPEDVMPPEKKDNSAKK